MVRIKLTVYVIAEDVYLRSLDAPAPPTSLTPLRGEKKLVHMVSEPEQMTVGLLVNEIKQRYQNIYRVWVYRRVKIL